MNKILLALSLLSFFISFTGEAQVEINALTPEVSSQSEGIRSNKGLTAPRVSLVDVTNNVSPISAPVEGLLVYNTNASVTSGSGTGYYYWSGSHWSKIITASVIDNKSSTTNVDTNSSSLSVGTVNNQNPNPDKEYSENKRRNVNDNVGINNINPEYTLDLAGDFRMNGDFINQQILGTHSGMPSQLVPIANSVFNPLTGTVNAITLAAGNGVNDSAVFITGFARVFGGSLVGADTSMGGYFLALERATDAGFTDVTVLTYTSGLCYIETPSGGSSSAPLAFGGGGHISYLDSGLTAGTSYYYRLTLVPNSIGLSSGNFEVFERDLIIMQLKQ